MSAMFGGDKAVRAPAIPPRTYSTRASQRVFLLVSALLFIASSAATVVWSASMSMMGEMPMPGGWAISTAWMQMPGRTWLDVAAPLAGMWVVMMIAMMLPSLAPSLSRYSSTSRFTAVAAVAYFLVWAALGIAVLPLGIAIAALEMQSPMLARAAPIAVGLVVLMAGALQFTKWKAHQLACCRETHGARALPANARTAFRNGVRAGLHCSRCCVGFVAMLLVFGVMDLRAMIAVTTAITAERVAPDGRYMARAIGALAVGTGLYLIARAALPA